MASPSSIKTLQNPEGVNLLTLVSSLNTQLQNSVSNRSYGILNQSESNTVRFLRFGDIQTKPETK